MRELDGLKTNERTSERARKATRHLEEMVGNPRCVGQSIHEVFSGANVKICVLFHFINFFFPKLFFRLFLLQTMMNIL